MTWRSEDWIDDGQVIVCWKLWWKAHLASSLALTASDLPLVGLLVLLFTPPPTPVPAFFAFGFEAGVDFFSGTWMVAYYHRTVLYRIFIIQLVMVMVWLDRCALFSIDFFVCTVLTSAILQYTLHFSDCTFDQLLPLLHSFYSYFLTLHFIWLLCIGLHCHAYLVEFRPTILQCIAFIWLHIRSAASFAAFVLPVG